MKIVVSKYSECQYIVTYFATYIYTMNHISHLQKLCWNLDAKALVVPNLNFSCQVLGNLVMPL